MIFEGWKKENNGETLLDMTRVWKWNCNGVKKGIKFTDLKTKYLISASSGIRIRGPCNPVECANYSATRTLLRLQGIRYRYSYQNPAGDLPRDKIVKLYSGYPGQYKVSVLCTCVRSMTRKGLWPSTHIKAATMSITADCMKSFQAIVSSVDTICLHSETTNK